MSSGAEFVNQCFGFGSLAPCDANLVPALRKTARHGSAYGVPCTN
jgi:hypothetical protein